MVLIIYVLVFEPWCEKTCFQDFRTSPTQTVLFRQWKWPEAWNVVFRIKTLIIFAVTAKLICASVFAHAKSCFSRVAAHLQNSFFNLHANIMVVNPHLGNFLSIYGKKYSFLSSHWGWFSRNKVQSKCPYALGKKIRCLLLPLIETRTKCPFTWGLDSVLKISTWNYVFY